MGTAFVATEESGAHPQYKAALVAAGGGDTVVGAGGESRTVRSEACDRPRRVELPRFAIPPPTAAFEGRIEAMALYAGDGVGAVRAIQPAANVVDRVVAEADELLA